jgi:adenine/guanine phosphoribosyltransferase-like PRPP-binding protein
MEERLRRTIRFIDGHVDTWSALADSSLFGAVTRTLAAPFESQDVTKIAAVEARGFVLGAAVALRWEPVSYRSEKTMVSFQVTRPRGVQRQTGAGGTTSCAYNGST